MGFYRCMSGKLMMVPVHCGAVVCFTAITESLQKITHNVFPCSQQLHNLFICISYHFVLIGSLHNFTFLVYPSKITVWLCLLQPVATLFNMFSIYFLSGYHRIGFTFLISIYIICKHILTIILVS